MKFSAPLVCMLLLCFPSAEQGRGEEGGERKDARDAQVHQRGLRIYRGACAACHQVAGQGMGVVFPPLAGSEWVQGDPTLAIKVVLKGMFGSIEVNGKTYIGAMQPHEDRLSDQQIAEVLTYVRQSWGNEEAAVDAATVKQVRKDVAGQTEMWEADDLKGELP